ncbi:carboxymuconolactone decarboxylase family protein [Janibacter sp. G349]|uniref:carboxymuconolactone decarboxylase family protein n=1 Tax=Janibacter sp. G349 TaxID=3405424 RepID=UPI003B7A99FE
MSAEVPVAAIDPLPLGDLPDPLRREIDGRLAAGTLSTSLPVQIWGRRPEAATAWVQLLGALQEQALLESRLRELVRLRIASFTQCRTCQAARKSDAVTEEDIACLAPDDDRFSAREQAALAYADDFVNDWFAIDDDTYGALGRHFTTDEVVELQMFCAMMLAGGRLALVQRAWAEDSDPAGERVSRE